MTPKRWIGLRLCSAPNLHKIEFPIQAEGRKSNSMQPVFETTNIQHQGEFVATPWSVAYYFFGR